MSDLRLVIFDVDGTLVDSQDMIFAAFTFAYQGLGLPLMSPAQDPATHRALAQRYRDAYFHLRKEKGSAATSPFFPGARAALDRGPSSLKAASGDGAGLFG